MAMVPGSVRSQYRLDALSINNEYPLIITNIGVFRNGKNYSQRQRHDLHGLRS